VSIRKLERWPSVVYTVNMVDKLQRVSEARIAASKATAELEDAMLQAVESGSSLRAVAGAAGFSHEYVRKLIARRASQTFAAEWEKAEMKRRRAKAAATRKRNAEAKQRFEMRQAAVKRIASAHVNDVDGPNDEV
jgi:hypothetical protein